MQHNDGKVSSLGSLLDVPVKLSNQIADKKTIKLTYTGDLLVSKLAVWIEQSLTVLNSSGMLVFNREYYLE